MSHVIALPHRPARLSAKLRSAIEANATQSLSIFAACGKAGMSRAGYHRVMQRFVALVTGADRAETAGREA